MQLRAGILTPIILREKFSLKRKLITTNFNLRNSLKKATENRLETS